MARLLDKLDPNKVAAALGFETWGLIFLLREIFDGENQRVWNVEGVDLIEATSVAIYQELSEVSGIAPADAIRILKDWPNLGPDPGYVILLYSAGKLIEFYHANSNAIESGPLSMAAKVVKENFIRVSMADQLTMVDMKAVITRVKARFNDLNFN